MSATISRGAGALLSRAIRRSGGLIGTFQPRPSIPGPSGSHMTRPDLPSLFASATPCCVQVSCISTSDKTKVVSAAEKIGTVEKSKATESLEDKEENWISFGYSLVDRDEDEWAHHMLMFAGITMLICWGGFYLAYMPDFRDRSWAQREAYLELDRREKKGLPLIDADLISQDKIILPSEEELADFEIVI